MNGLLEISKDDISQLDDTQLRDLIGLLCEADLRSVGLPTTAVTWGGHQDESDGGVDVRVESKSGLLGSITIPNQNTIIQVKKSDISPSKIDDEIRPLGILKKSISELIINKGAYIIVSGDSTTTDLKLRTRQDKLKSIFSEYSSDIQSDYFDGNRVASWVRNYPQLIIWVKNRINNKQFGWESFGNWAQTPEGKDQSYIIDEEASLIDGSNKNKKYSILDGIHLIRNSLAKESTSVRLTGLSGVGKTRFAQALFDSEVGENSLNSSLVIYTDISNSPDPMPVHFIEQLKYFNQTIILIVDNCLPDLHSSLTKKVTNSKISLLTIEYDVKDDIPDETDVYKLEPSSIKSIESLIKSRYDHISSTDIRSIAEFSGGNYRVAIYLANTLNKGECLSDLKDNSLLERLFFQRNKPDSELLQSAEALSLLYSFEGEDILSEESELKFIASLIDKKVSKLFADVQVLRDREIIQKRNKWRAILPQVIANKLAVDALKRINNTFLLQSLEESASERVLISFSRRLSTLHTSEEAVRIVEKWLQPKGLIGISLRNISGYKLSILMNIAPVAPELVLTSIENIIDDFQIEDSDFRNNWVLRDIVKLIWHIGYEPKYFYRCANLICFFVLKFEEADKQHTIRNFLDSYFQLYLSGTHASLEDKLLIIKNFVSSEDAKKCEVGVSLLEKTLNSDGFTSSFQFDFGSRSRDYGYEPKLNSDIIKWYSTFLSYSLDLIEKDISQKRELLNIILEKFRSLWSRCGQEDLLISFCEGLLSKGQEVHKIWVKVKGIIKYDLTELPISSQEKLKELEIKLRPKTLIEEVEIFALSNEHYIFNDEDTIDSSDETSDNKLNQKTIEVGVKLIQDQKLFETLINRLLQSDGFRIFELGFGLAKGANNKNELWSFIKGTYEVIKEEKSSIKLLQGFLYYCSENEKVIYNQVLDQLLIDPILGVWFVDFQLLTKVDDIAYTRLIKSLKGEIIDYRTFKFLAYGRRHENINDNKLASIINLLLRKESGITAIIEILSTRFERHSLDKKNYSVKLINSARKALEKVSFDKEEFRRDLNYSLEPILIVCYGKSNHYDSAKVFTSNIYQALSDYKLTSRESKKILDFLCEFQPLAFLDTFIVPEKMKEFRPDFTYKFHFGRDKNPIDNIPEKAILKWCSVSMEERIIIMSEICQLYKYKDEQCFWKPLFYKLLSLVENLEDFLGSVSKTIHPSSWSGGTLPSILTQRKPLFESLKMHKDNTIKKWASEELNKLEKSIKWAIESDRDREKEETESFE